MREVIQRIMAQIHDGDEEDFDYEVKNANVQKPCFLRPSCDWTRFVETIAIASTRSKWKA